MSQSTILIVDDDPALLNALTGALQLRLPEVSVESCESGITAIEKISHTEYDAIVTDIKMPGMDGLTLLKEIRKIQPDLPTLLITGHGQHDLAVQALRGGAFDFIQKPIERDYFVASLNRAILMRKMARQLQRQQIELASHANNLEKLIDSRTQQLRESNRRKDEFLAVLSHELRNPLACILSTAEVALLSREDGLLPQVDCHVIVQQAAHMRRLLDDLLDLSRINSNKIGLQKQHIGLEEIVEAAVVSTKSFLRDRGHSLAVHIDPAVAECRLWADATRLEQVMVNLLTNAAKYSEAGSVIDLSAHVDNGELVVEVADEGIGIPADALPNVFEPFVQVDANRERAGGGLGIGLALVRQIVELHSGSVTAASGGDCKGSCFTVRLPREKEPHTEFIEEPPLPNSLLVSPRRILVVEDQEILGNLTRKLLESAGQQVVAMATDGESAIEAAKLHLPDLILMDIGLPGMSGYEAAQQIREISELDGVVLVAMTGYGTQFDRERSKKFGFDFHLVKPCEYEVLMECIENAGALARAKPTRFEITSSTGSFAPPQAGGWNPSWNRHFYRTPWRSCV